MVSGIILCASYDEANLWRVVDAFNSALVYDVVVMCNEDEASAHRSTWFSGKIISKKSSEGEIASIIDGLNVLGQDELHGILVIPSSQKLISQEIVVQLLHQFWISHKSIAVASFDGQRTFPVIISESLFAELRNSPQTASVESFVDKYENDVKVVEFDADGYLIKKQAIRNREISTNE